MNETVKALLLAAAGTGLVAGSGSAPSTPASAGRTLVATDPGQAPATFAQDAKHACKGLNACKGQGGCSSGDMGCKGKNTCKGKGGCATNM